MNDKYLNYTAALLAFTFLVLLVGKEGKVPGQTIAALLLILAVALVWPGVALFVAVPIFILVWFRHVNAVFTYLKSL